MAARRIPGVNVGPLDPDTTAEFGRVGRANRARLLIRHHDRMYPAPLRQALKLPLNEPRSEEDAIDLAEVEEVVRAAIAEDRQKVPKGFSIVGANVRGTDGGKLWLCYAFEVKSGRVSKGAIRFTQERFPISWPLGEEQKVQAKLKKGGLPTADLVRLLQAQAQAGSPASTSDPELADALVRATEALEVATAHGAEQNARIEALETALAERGETPPDPDPDPAAAGAPDEDERKGDVSTGEDEDGDDGDLLHPPEVLEPWDGYEGSTAHVIAEKLKADHTAELAQAVLDYETASDGQNRATVVKAANAVLSSTSPRDDD